MSIFHSIINQTLSSTLWLWRFCHTPSVSSASIIARLENSAQTQMLSDEQSLICSYLQKYPHWTAGHLELARNALKLDDVALAYASALAVQQLSSTANQLNEASLIQARCYLRRGSYAQAQVLFEKLLQTNPSDAAITEDLAASLMAQDRNTLALEYLSKVPAENLSASALAAKKFLQQRSAAQ